MAKAITNCPNCGATVSQFAAGCAICGEDLIAARQLAERRREALPSVVRLDRPAWLPRISGADAVLGGLLLIVAVFSPVIGGPIAALFAYFAHQKGDLIQRNLALAAVAVALVVLILVSFLPERSYELLPWIDLSGPLPTN